MTSLTICLTLYDRPIEVIERTFASLASQAHDAMVIVLDRSPKKVTEYVRDYWKGDGRVNIAEIAGLPGWRGPAKAWNVGFERVKTDLLYCISSEVVQEPGNVARAKEVIERYDGRAIVFGKAECSCGPDGREVNWGDGNPGNLLVDSKHPRPLGFIWAGPMEPVRQIGGFDEAYMRGYWFDDDDMTYRLYRAMPRYVFDDSISGVHQHHERLELTAEGIERNRQYHAVKYRNMNCKIQPKAIYWPRPGVCVWEGEK